jgi:DNA-binding transcriptional LysR family regulator
LAQHDLGAKHAFLRAGLGWGSMPLDVVEADIAAGVLIALKFEDGPAPGGFVMPL